MADIWPTELFDENEWPDEIKKPDAIYLSGGVVYLDLFTDNPVRLGEFGETEIGLKRGDKEGHGMYKKERQPKVVKIDPADVSEQPTFRSYVPSDDEEEGFDAARGATLFTVVDKPEYHDALPGDLLDLHGIRYVMVGRQYKGDAVIFHTDHIGPVPLNEL